VCLTGWQLQKGYRSFIQTNHARRRIMIAVIKKRGWIDSAIDTKIDSRERRGGTYR
jgi:hypothetical protein